MNDEPELAAKRHDRQMTYAILLCTGGILGYDFFGAIGALGMILAPAGYWIASKVVTVYDKRRIRRTETE